MNRIIVLTVTEKLFNSVYKVGKNEQTNFTLIKGTYLSERKTNKALAYFVELLTPLEIPFLFIDEKGKKNFVKDVVDNKYVGFQLPTKIEFHLFEYADHDRLTNEERFKKYAKKLKAFMDLHTKYIVLKQLCSSEEYGKFKARKLLINE
jgi:hypothetical protein